MKAEECRQPLEKTREWKEICGCKFSLKYWIAVDALQKKVSLKKKKNDPKEK